MSFEKDLKLALEDIEIPDALLPENIEAMLRKSAGQKTETKPEIEMSRNERSSAVKKPEKSRPVVVTAKTKRKDRTVVMRSIAAVAACAALGAGFMAYFDRLTQPVELESEIDYEAVKIQSYDELYTIYTGIYLNNAGDSSAANGDGIEIITDDTGDEPAITAALETQPAITEAAQTEDVSKKAAEEAENVRSDFSDADIVKSDDKSIYYICNGTLYVVSKDNMAVTAEILNENEPFEMYVRGSSLVLVSSESASDSQSENVVVDIYDISADAPVRIKTYKQNGVYNSARIDDNEVMYLATDYSDYRETPLDETASLETYVPGYYVDGEKYYVAAEDITVPQGANNTDYTIISAIKCSEPVNISVKAVLGTSANAYCSDDTLYVAGTGNKNGKDYTAVTAFAISESGLDFKAAAVLDGKLISRSSMNEYNDAFRIACRDYDDMGMINTNIYTLDLSLNVVSKAGALLPGTIASSVKFDGEYASIMESGKDKATLIVDLTQSAPVYDMGISSFDAAYTTDLSDNYILGISALADENGVYNSLKLEMYDNLSGVKVNEISFAEFDGVQSPALTDKKALLVDQENKIIGVPVSSVNEFGVKNQYFVFGYDENGFAEKGVFEYNDIDDSNKFERAVINEGMLYIIGSGRMVSVRISDMTVVEYFDFQ